MAYERKFKIGKPILEVNNISLAFGGVKAITDTSFNVLEHEVRAIIGPNGAGKSSMLNCINGIYKPQKGTVSFRGQEIPNICLLYTSPSPRDMRRSRMPSSA